MKYIEREVLVLYCKSRTESVFTIQAHLFKEHPSVTKIIFPVPQTPPAWALHSSPLSGVLASVSWRQLVKSLHKQ